MTIRKFLKKFGIKDNPNMSPKRLNELRGENIYYIASSGQGYLYPKVLIGATEEELETHRKLTLKAEDN